MKEDDRVEVHLTEESGGDDWENMPIDTEADIGLLEHPRWSSLR